MENLELLAASPKAANEFIKRLLKLKNGLTLNNLALEIKKKYFRFSFSNETTAQDFINYFYTHTSFYKINWKVSTIFISENNTSSTNFFINAAGTCDLSGLNVSPSP